VFKAAFKVPAVGMFGAGDGFDAAFLGCRLRGLGESLEGVNVVGALCVTVRGNVEAVPTYEDVRRFLERKEDFLR